MMIFIISIILFIVSIVFIIISINNSKKIRELNSEIDKENEELEYKNKSLKKESFYLSTENKQLLSANEKLYDEHARIEKALDSHKEVSNQAMSSYIDSLETAYKQAEEEFDNKQNDLEKDYLSYCENLSKEIEKEKDILNSIRATRKATQQAILKEKEIEENLTFYCLPISVTDRNDIQVLERVKSQLNKPRILSMLIWSTYFQKPMTTLCNNILGTQTVIGIYKITNQINKKCYIGQSVDVSRRFKDHAKCGLGIDTPAGNKLYKAMIEDGIWNFSWELLETCSKEELDKKEKYYIELYDSKNYGYNITQGNK
jgi:chemotaxis protein CheY-P-specific phosphatase CheC